MMRWVSLSQNLGFPRFVLPEGLAQSTEGFLPLPCRPLNSAAAKKKTAPLIF
jgi:hypothetical protein